MAEDLDFERAMERHGNNAQLRQALADVLRTTRASRGMLQGELAALAGVGIGDVAAWEKGQSTPPLLTLVRIGAAIKIPGYRLLRRAQNLADARETAWLRARRGTALGAGTGAETL